MRRLAVARDTENWGPVFGKGPAQYKKTESGMMTRREIIPLRNGTSDDRPQAAARYRRARLSLHQHVGELPGIAGVDALRKELAAVDERRPVGVATDHRAEIGPLQLEAAPEIHFIGFDNAAVRVLEHPDDAGEHRRGDLEAGRVLVGRELPRLLDRELRAVPVGVLGVAVEQDAELVDAVDDVVLGEDVPSLLRLPLRARELVEREHGVVAGVIG